MAGWGTPIVNLTGPQGSPGDPGSPGEPGSPGAPGSVWYAGAGAPDSGVGIAGDYYLNTTDGAVYQKT